MSWHTIGAGEPRHDVAAFEAESLRRYGVDLREVPPRYRTTYFAHIWDGGYHAGYFAYLWAEVLDHDFVQSLPSSRQYFTLARMAGEHHHVPDLFDAYCQRCAPVPLPSVVGGLSLLVARGILHERT